MTWFVKQLEKAPIKNPVLIEGLPGMGNVGKIAVDFIIDALKARKIYELFSYDLPHCVFINKDNLIELPSISVYQKNLKNRTLLFIAGDIQPISEASCYEFCNTVLDTFQRTNLEIITLGGIALPKVPNEPKIYCTGNSKKYISKFRSSLVHTQLYGAIGPIVGVSGLLPGLAAKRKIPAAALLAETFGHPNYLGIKGARSILKVLNDQLNLDIDLEELDEEIKDVGEEFTNKAQSLDKATRLFTKKVASSKGADYIG